MCVPNSLDNIPDNFSPRHAQLQLDFLNYFWFSGSAYRGSGVGEGGEMGRSGYTKAYAYVGSNVSSSRR
jgi:hypothetical protein